MVNPFICINGGFHNQAEEDDEFAGSPSSTPPWKARKSGGLCRSKDSKNPYAGRGLDKFAALLTELEDKRRKIYTQMGPDEISLVRFVYSSSDDCKPIVVKVKNRHKHQEIEKKSPGNNSETSENNSPVDSGNETRQSRNELDDQKTMEKKKKRSNPWSRLMMKMKKDMWRRPSLYLLAITILILLFLALSGRSFAIVCTSLGWYLVPAINGGSSSSIAKRPIGKKKKEFGRRASDKKIASNGLSSPTSVIAEAMNDVSPRQRGHRKSW
ncbi:hypothetical protein U1Q18_016407 [Sarracenia purpurea var. burkii]